MTERTYTQAELDTAVYAAHDAALRRIDGHKGLEPPNGWSEDAKEGFEAGVLDMQSALLGSVRQLEEERERRTGEVWKRAKEICASESEIWEEASEQQKVRWVEEARGERQKTARTYTEQELQEAVAGAYEAAAADVSEWETLFNAGMESCLQEIISDIVSLTPADATTALATRDERVRAAERVRLAPIIHTLCDHIAAEVDALESDIAIYEDDGMTCAHSDDPADAPTLAHICELEGAIMAARGALKGGDA